MDSLRDQAGTVGSCCGVTQESERSFLQPVQRNLNYLLPHQLVETADRFPLRRAVACGDEELTYAELAGLSGTLAAALVEHGVGRGDRVGIDLPKSVRAVVSVFGILRAGGVYVPVDLSVPPVRAAGEVAGAWFGPDTSLTKVR